MKYKRYKIGSSSNYNAIISSIWLFILLQLTTTVQCSEFPERECCDPPPNPDESDSDSNNINVVESPIEPMIPSTPSSTIIGHSGESCLCIVRRVQNYRNGNFTFAELLRFSPTVLRIPRRKFATDCAKTLLSSSSHVKALKSHFIKCLCRAREHLGLVILSFDT